jgi:SAM-dependent methyltransferase
MSIGVFIVIMAGAAFAALGSRRLHLPRKPGPEGIEAPEVAEAYDRITRWPQVRLLRRMVVARLAKYQPKGILIDIGCGPGRLTTLIAQRHQSLHVVGIDSAEEMIRTAASNASSLGLSDRVQFRLGDVASLPMPDRTVDFAVSTFLCITGPIRALPSPKSTVSSSLEGRFSCSTSGGIRAATSTGY